MDLWLTQTLTEMSTTSIYWGERWPVCRADNLHLSIVLKSVSLNLLENLGPVQTWNGIALPLHLWAPGPVRSAAENLAPPPRLQLRTVQLVGRRYTDWASACKDVSTTGVRITYSSGNHLVARQRAEQVMSGDMLHSLKGDGKGFEG
jgi:hypothetical protein